MFVLSSSLRIPDPSLLGDPQTSYQPAQEMTLSKLSFSSTQESSRLLKLFTVYSRQNLMDPFFLFLRVFTLETCNCKPILMPLKCVCVFYSNLGLFLKGFPGGSSGKEPSCQFRRHERCGFDPWVRKIPWRRKWQPNPVFLPEESPWTEEPGGLYSTGLQRVRQG